MFLLNGLHLTSKELFELSRNHIKIGISNEAFIRVDKSYEFLKKACSNLNLYGINTGLGPMALVRIREGGR
jgi:histidine ammonia-lyase